MSRPRGRITVWRGRALSDYGYYDIKHTPAHIRREALVQAIRAHGYLPVMRRVNAIAILNKNRAPKTGAVARADVNWMVKAQASAKRRELRGKSR